MCLVISLAGPALGENAIELGLKGAVNMFTPVPEEKARPALSAADSALRQYLKKTGENHLCQYTAGLSSEWIELNGLKLSGVTYGVVSEADRANGIRERINVSVACAMHRKRKPGASSWTQWANGLPLLMPGTITVELAADGRWSARESSLKYFNPIGSATPAIGTPANGLPPGVSRPAAQPALEQHAPSGRIATQAPATVTRRPPPSRSPEQSARQPIQPPQAPPARKSGNTAKDRQATPFGALMPPLVVAAVVAAVAVVFMAILSLVLKKATQRDRCGQVGGPIPPPIARRPAASPPPLPVNPQAPANSPVDLIQRSENLMTPAELAFFAILEPLVRPTCMISSKVRLADLFHVAPGAGQQSAFNKISRKHIDFVLTDPATSRILCGIELDDRSHNQPDRVDRDSFVNEVFARNQLPLLRVPVAWTYYPPALHAALIKAGLTLSPWVAPTATSPHH